MRTLFRLCALVVMLFVLVGVSLAQEEATPEAIVDTVGVDVPVIVTDTEFPIDVVTETPPVEPVDSDLNPNDALLSSLVVGAGLVFGILFIAQSVLVGWLANNNVKLVDPKLIESFFTNLGARVLEAGYTYAKQTKTTADEELLLSWSSTFYDKTENPDGTITLTPKPKSE